MPKRSAPAALASEANVAAHVGLERERRGWSTAELARRVTEAGCPLSQSAVWRIENGDPPRKISVDEMVAFGKVFERSVEELLLPVSSEFPESLVRLYVNKWVDAHAYLKRIQVQAGVILGDVTSAAWAFPAADQVIREMIVERVVETVGLKDLAGDYLAEYEKALAFHREHEGAVPGLGPAEIIIGGRADGMTDDEIIQLAAAWGAEESVREAFTRGVVRYFEPDFAGGAALDQLTIKDGKVVRSAELQRGESDDVLAGVSRAVRDARIAKGLTVEEVAKQTKFPAMLVSAVENELERRSKTRPDVMRSALRVIARALDLDPKPLVDKFNRRRPPTLTRRRDATDQEVRDLVQKLL
ncbi:helix-turn-helix domain-containing protein [Streptomyces sp. NPDC008121]|uniref:helix-turn-helix domain-containing protein n=1 Tax=Streptomyces sp. NPDC008121 TaxID=3364809 RepID=UPI0036EEA69E